MVSSRNARPSVDGTPIVISAPTLKEAQRRVHQEIGDDAIIISTRNVIRREELGLGQKKVVELLVQDPSVSTTSNFQPSTVRSLGKTQSLPDDPDDRNREIDRTTVTNLNKEVERIEALVTQVAKQFSAQQQESRVLLNPLAETLHHGGVSVAVLERLFTRLASEAGQTSHTRTEAITWLTENLRASNCDWDGFYGCHAFLGKSGAGRSQVVLQAAARLQGLGKHTLVLSIMPANSGEIRHLQSEAGKHGFDAAVIRKEGQLAASEAHLADYDVVLVDMPALDHPLLAEGQELHSWLAGNPGFHRHLLISGDQDPSDLDTLARAAKSWNCDWIVVTRLDQTLKPGKILDFTDTIPLPISLAGFGPRASETLEIASSVRLIDLILNQGSGLTDGRLNIEGRA